MAPPYAFHFSNVANLLQSLLIILKQELEHLSPYVTRFSSIHSNIMQRKQIDKIDLGGSYENWAILKIIKHR